MGTVGQNIRKLREAKGDSQQAFARRFGLSRGQIASYEAIERASEPTVETILAIVDFFNIDLRRFLTDPLFEAESANSATSSEPVKKTSAIGIQDKGQSIVRPEIILATPDVGSNRTVPIINRKAAANYQAAIRRRSTLKS